MSEPSHLPRTPPLVDQVLDHSSVWGVSSADELLEEALHAVRTHMGMEVAFISEVKDDRRFFRYIEQQNGALELNVGDSDPAEESYCKRVLDGRLPELIQNAVELPEARKIQATQDIPVGAHISVPICFSDGRVFGTLCCFDREADETLSERDLGLMRTFASFVSKQIEREEARHEQWLKGRKRIEQVLDRQEFHVVLQPIYDLKTKQALGFEALARFGGEPRRGPDQWLDEAHTVGLREELELALIAQALRHLKDIPAEHYLSLNASPRVIQSGRLYDLLCQYPLNRIMLEVTEEAAVEDYDLLHKALSGLRDGGVRLAIDDAGAGYASFRHIVRLRPDMIKLDRTLIDGIATNAELRALAVAMARFADEIGAKVVAEGIENEHDLEALLCIGVHAAQGYYLGEPERADTYDFSAFVP
ncbi:EAL domain-containing protein [Thioalkalivibrio sp. ALMg9]|uniref:sensor domain-containing phosphodiesterase n=1 Tax=Thioalkalivibrio sp. ALMg9 TaxID=1266912 RepID=UPI000475A1FC|nr:EAL domain-containing protein [Thioalkalivibrio sp. ALMg9]